VDEKYAVANASAKIAGYFMPSPSKPGGEPAEFERAKMECIAHLEYQLAKVRSVTFETFQKSRGVVLS
jgi:hypothetical protein